MTRILVTGTSGLLGINFALRFAAKHPILGLTNTHPLKDAPFASQPLDLTDPAALNSALDAFRPEIVLHCAALANIDACERSPLEAERINAWVPEQLALAAAQRGFKLVHLSTDAVFDGQKGDYVETDQPNPLSVYARTKLQAEQRVLAANPDALVARVNFYGWSVSGQRSLGEFFYNNLSQGRRVNGFMDVFFCPLEVTLLAETLLRLAELDCRGIYHVVSSQCWSKYAFGCAIAQRFGLDEGLITPLSVQQGGLTAARSPNLGLNTDKLTTALGTPAPGQAQGLQRFYQHYLDGFPQRVRALGQIPA
jgi:dTDP-4-dehydrorhamnose reductase